MVKDVQLKSQISDCNVCERQINVPSKTSKVSDISEQPEYSGICVLIVVVIGDTFAFPLKRHRDRRTALFLLSHPRFVETKVTSARI